MASNPDPLPLQDEISLGDLAEGEGYKQRQYLDMIANLSTAGFPNLALLNKILSRAQTLDGRVVVLEFLPTAPTHSEQPTTSTSTPAAGPRILHHDIESPRSLLEYLNQEPTVDATLGPIKPSRLFLFEDLIPAYVNIMGEHFSIDPAFFAGHLLSANWLEMVEKGGEAPRLPSSSLSLKSRVAKPMAEQNFWTLLFYEMLVFPNPESLRGRHEIFRDANVYRKVHYAKPATNRVSCGIAHSNASFWSKPRNEAVGQWLDSPIGWDAIMLLDPSATSSLVSGRFSGISTSLPGEIEAFLYQGGYVDFRHIPAPFNFDGAYLSPPRTSLLDDILFYWTSKADDAIASAVNDPSGQRAAVFLKPIVASNWILLIEFLKQTICRLELQLENRGKDPLSADLIPDKDIELPLKTLERNLADTHMWRRRCAQYHEQMRANCRALGIPHEGNNCGSEGDQATESDFQFIIDRLASWKQRAEVLVGVLMSQLSILDQRRSFTEAKGVTRLTVLGLFFIPLSLVSAVLSMGDPFRPGGQYFWVFFATGFPMVVIVFFLAFGTNGFLGWLSVGPKFKELKRRYTLSKLTPWHPSENSQFGTVSRESGMIGAFGGIGSSRGSDPGGVFPDVHAILRLGMPTEVPDIVETAITVGNSSSLSQRKHESQDQEFAASDGEAVLNTHEQAASARTGDGGDIELGLTASYATHDYS